LGGLVAVAALLLLLFLFKKKKKPPDLAEETVESESAVGSAGEMELYISEYGLSDGVRPVDGDDDREDLPNVAGSGDALGSDFAGASEHNPDDIENIQSEPDEHV
jgi:hypothetical protein